MPDLETVEKVVKGDTFFNTQFPQPTRSATLASAHHAKWPLALAPSHAWEVLASAWHVRGHPEVFVEGLRRADMRPQGEVNPSPLCWDFPLEECSRLSVG